MPALVGCGQCTLEFLEACRRLTDPFAVLSVKRWIRHGVVDLAHLAFELLDAFGQAFQLLAILEAQLARLGASFGRRLSLDIARDGSRWGSNGRGTLAQ